MTYEELSKAVDEYNNNRYYSTSAISFSLVLEAAREHLKTLSSAVYVPDVWHVEAVYPASETRKSYRLHIEIALSKQLAEETTYKLRKLGFECIRVTGPHEHWVPHSANE